MRKLNAAGNRGDTLRHLGGHLGGHLTNYTHDYEHSASLVQWEYEAVVNEVIGDAFHVAVKNRLTASDVIEFLSLIARETELVQNVR